MKFLSFKEFVLVITLIVGLATASNVFSRTFNELHEDPGPQTAGRIWVPTKWIEQKLDHFNASETRTWQMVRGLRNYPIFGKVF